MGAGRGIPVPSQLLGEGPRTSEAGPEGPAGLEWWVLGPGRPGEYQVFGGGDGYLDHPAGPVGAPLVPLPVQIPLECRLWAIWRD